MKKTYLVSLLLPFLYTCLYAQEMPAVFNKSLAEKGNQYKKVIVIDDEENILAVGGGQEGIITKCNRNGDILFNKVITKGGISFYNDITADRNANLVAVGGGTIGVGNSRITKLTPKGDIIFDKSIGQKTGGYFTRIIVDSSNNYIAIGTDGSKPSSARIVKFTAKGDVIFDKAFGTHNVFFDAALTEDGDIVAVGGDVGDMEGRARITKISQKGDVVFDVELARTGASFTKVVLLSDDNVLVVGGGAYGTGNPCRIAKLRGEDGQVIYDKPYSTADGRFSDVYVNNDGRVVACAEEYEQGRIVQLRPDGTEIYNKTFSGAFHALKMGTAGEVVAVGELGKMQGKMVKLRGDGAVMYDNAVDLSIGKMLLTEDGEVYALSSKGYNLLKYDPYGRLMFNKTFGNYGDAVLNVLEQSPSGEVIAGGGGLEDGGRLIKITHGLVINDVTVSEPVNGVSTASLTVSLTGFLRRKGIRSPVTVNYATSNGSASHKEDYVQTEGSLFFVPSDYFAGSSITQTIQVPLLSDNLLEGKETFDVALTKAQNAYITKAKATVAIIDQPAMLKFVGGKDGTEKDLQPVNFYAGIFKQDNSPLINKTGSPLDISYSFGSGSAMPGTDFVASTKPLFTIDTGRSEGVLQVKVKDDNSYELKKSVILELNGAKTANESIIGFEGGASSLTRMQYIIDQPAYVGIMKLADRNRSATTPSSMFRIVLTKEDGNILTNCTGDDIKVFFGIDESSSASLGKDFVILEGDMVKMLGECDNAETVLKVVTVNSRTQEDDKTVAVKISSVTGPQNAGALLVNPDDKWKKTSAVIRGTK